MGRSDEKRELRQLKRTIKRRGNKRLRSLQKKNLAKNPEEAHWYDGDYSEYSTKSMNGLFRKLAEDELG